MFSAPEFGLAGFTENQFNGPLFAGLDAFIQIFECPAQMTRQRLAHGALACTHKAHQKHQPRRRKPARARRYYLPGANPVWFPCLPIAAGLRPGG